MRHCPLRSVAAAWVFVVLAALLLPTAAATGDAHPTGHSYRDDRERHPKDDDAAPHILEAAQWEQIRTGPFASAVLFYSDHAASRRVLPAWARIVQRFRANLSLWQVDAEGTRFERTLARHVAEGPLPALYGCVDVRAGHRHAGSLRLWTTRFESEEDWTELVRDKMRLLRRVPQTGQRLKIGAVWPPAGEGAQPAAALSPASPSSPPEPENSDGVASGTDSEATHADDGEASAVADEPASAPSDTLSEAREL